MNIGMLWQDKAPLKERLAHAIDYYRAKYHAEPNAAFVNPKLLEGVEVGDLDAGIVTVRPMREIAVNALWIGVERAARGVEQESTELLKDAAEVL